VGSHEGSFITALDKNTGNELWRVSRDESTRGPRPMSSSRGAAQVIVPA
jgi:hypothetical protein